MKKFILLAICLITAVIFAQMLIGETPQTLKPTVVSIIGKAELKSANNQWIPLAKTTVLALNDTIRTGAKSFAEIQLAENTVIKLSENTEVTLQEMQTEKLKKKSIFGKEGQQLNRIKLNMVNGQILSKLQKRDSTKNSFSLNTPVAVCGVRGTEFVTSHSGENTNVDVIEGVVDVYNNKFPNKNIKVTAGQTTNIAQNKEPEKPKPLSNEEREKFRQMFAPAENRGSQPSTPGTSKPVEKKNQKSSGNVKLKVDM